jgi:hypothetical protein
MLERGFKNVLLILAVLICFSSNLYSKERVYSSSKQCGIFEKEHKSFGMPIIQAFDESSGVIQVSVETIQKGIKKGEKVDINKWLNEYVRYGDPKDIERRYVSWADDEPSINFFDEDGDEGLVIDVPFSIQPIKSKYGVAFVVNVYLKKTGENSFKVLRVGVNDAEELVHLYPLGKIKNGALLVEKANRINRLLDYHLDLRMDYLEKYVLVLYRLKNVLSLEDFKYFDGSKCSENDSANCLVFGAEGNRGGNWIVLSKSGKDIICRRYHSEVIDPSVPMMHAEYNDVLDRTMVIKKQNSFGGH